MLENTLATTFTPGTNLKNNVAGANWSFLLPRFALDCVVCYGMPGHKALKTLRRMASELVIVTSEDDRGKAPEGARLLRDKAPLSLADKSVDLVYIVSRKARHDIERDSAMLDEIARILKPDGFVYTELSGPADWFVGSGLLDRLEGYLGHATRYWLTPLRGEAQTAVPETDAATRRYFVEHSLFAPTMQVAAIGSAKSSETPMRKSGDSRGGRSRIKQLRQRLRPLANAVQNASNRTEAALHRRTTLLSRRGVLIGQNVDTGVPQYLSDIAVNAGIDLHGWRWGLAARGEYSSRKVLFFLYPPASDRPTYIVKMVRDAVFNPRVENEQCALRWLEEQGIGDSGMVPRAAFFGYHGGLALVGETIVQGAPFRSATKGADSVTLASEALNWLVDLSAATANREAASPEVVAASLQVLLDRFVEIYQPELAERAFLNEQVDVIRRSAEQFPLVFQHGDPGVWNVVVTPDGHTAFLDWEAAEIRGMPLWDIFYYWRSFSIDMARREGVQDALDGFQRHFLSASPLHAMLALAVRRVCDTTGLAAEAVRPLFYLCWVHRALKQATLLPAAQVNQSHYRNLLARSIDRRDDPALQSLLLVSRS